MRHYSDQERAEAMARLLAGGSLGAVARETGIARSTLSAWRKETRTLVPAAGSSERTQLGEHVFDLIAETLKSLTAQARFFRDAEWLSRQSAGDMAILHGVLSDKVIRLLAAIREPKDEGRTVDG